MIAKVIMQQSSGVTERQKWSDNESEQWSDNAREQWSDNMCSGMLTTEQQWDNQRYTAGVTIKEREWAGELNDSWKWINNKRKVERK